MLCLTQKTVSKSEFVSSQSLIREVKALFSKRLAERLGLIEVQAPLLSEVGTGVQDDLNGVEQPVRVHIRQIPDKKYEVVHSLAKWKRMILGAYGFQAGEGIVTHMKALRPDEDVLGPLHSVMVDQWDWEKVITDEERVLSGLEAAAKTIYAAIGETQQTLSARFGIEPFLSEKLHFVHSEELCSVYPHLTPREREDAICRELGAVFIVGIGGELADGAAHDGRAPDYDDWTTETSAGRRGLNGDLFVWNPVLERAFELSSMGIRVDARALRRQLAIRGLEHRLQFPWHQSLLAGQLPQTIGGGIGQSRLAMLLLRKAHIAEVQFGVWPERALAI